MYIPSYKGVMVWTIGNCVADYNLDRFALIIKDLNCANWEPKLCDGSLPWNGNDVTQMLKPAVDKLHALDVKAGGWCAPYPGVDIPTQARLFADRLCLGGFDYAVVDAEGSWKVAGAADKATQYMNILREELGPDFAIGLCSFRWPSYHPEFPWKEFLVETNFHMPQVYWVQAHNPAEQLAKSIQELKALKDIPIYPVGAAYSENGWASSVDEINAFDKACSEMDVLGNSWWDLDRGHGILRSTAIYDAIKAHPWKTIVPPVIPPDDTTEQLAARIAVLEGKAREMETDIEQLSGFDAAFRDGQLAVCQRLDKIETWARTFQLFE